MPQRQRWLAVEVCVRLFGQDELAGRGNLQAIALLLMPDDHQARVAEEVAAGNRSRLRPGSLYGTGIVRVVVWLVRHRRPRPSTRSRSSVALRSVSTPMFCSCSNSKVLLTSVDT